MNQLSANKTTGQPTSGGYIVAAPGLEMDFQTWAVRTGDQTLVQLTRQEFKLLELLAAKRGHVVTKTMTFDFLYADARRPGSDTKILDVLKCKLLDKLGVMGERIQDFWGRGPVLDPEPAEKRRKLLSMDAIVRVEESLRSLAREGHFHINAAMVNVLPQLDANDRYTPARKAAIVVAIRNDLITREFAQKAYCATPGEIEEWESVFDTYGQAALSATHNLKRANETIASPPVYS